MKTIVIVAGIVLAGAAFIAVVQNDKKKVAQPVHQEGDGHQHDNAAQPGTSLLNPEHGQPGHRCDLPVGAPLNSAVPTPSSAPVMQMNPSPAMPANGQKTNPAHGQPGHRCDLPVGAPLS